MNMRLAAGGLSLRLPPPAATEWQLVADPNELLDVDTPDDLIRLGLN